MLTEGFFSFLQTQCFETECGHLRTPRVETRSPIAVNCCKSWQESVLCRETPNLTVEEHCLPRTERTRHSHGHLSRGCQPAGYCQVQPRCFSSLDSSLWQRWLWNQVSDYFRTLHKNPAALTHQCNQRQQAVPAFLVMVASALARVIINPGYWQKPP